MLKSASGPARVALTASASIMVSVGTALAVAAGVGGFLVDRGVHHIDERLEQLLQSKDQVSIRQRDGRLRGQAAGQALVGVGELGDRPLAGSMRLSSCSTPITSFS